MDINMQSYGVFVGVWFLISMPVSVYLSKRKKTRKALPLSIFWSVFLSFIPFLSVFYIVFLYRKPDITNA